MKLAGSDDRLLGSAPSVGNENEWAGLPASEPAMRADQLFERLNLLKLRASRCC